MRSEEREAGLRISILEGSFAVVHFTITAGPFATAFALLLGATDFQIGLLASLAPLSSIFSLLSAYWISKAVRRKPINLFTSVTSRNLWLFAIPLAFFPFSQNVNVFLFLLLVAFSNIFFAMAGNSWQDWMTDLVPLERRGRYFAIRNTLHGGIAIIVNIGAGILLDHYKSQGKISLGFSILFSIAVFCATTAFIILTRQPEPEMKIKKSESISLSSQILLPFQNTNFRHFLIFSSFWTIITGIPTGYFATHMLKNLHVSFSQIAFYSIIAGIISIPAQPIAGILIDRIGNKPVLTLSIIGVITLPLFWFFALPSFLLPLYIDSFLSGIFWPAIALSSFNLLLVTSPEENRATFLACITTITGILGFFSSLVGATLATILSSFNLSIGPQTLVNFHILFLISSLGRAISLIFLRKIKEEKAKPVGVVIHWLTDAFLRRIGF